MDNIIATSISITSLLIAASSFISGRKAANRSQEIALQAQRDTVLKPYTEKLDELKKKYRPVMAELYSKAQCALTEIVNEMDNYDEAQKSERYLRHITSDLIDSFYCLFNDKIPYRSPHYVAPLYCEIFHLEHNLSNSSHNLWRDKNSKALSKEYLRRLQDKESAYNFAIMKSQDVWSYLDDIRPGLKVDINELEEIKLNQSHREIRIEHSGHVNAHYSYMVSLLKFLEGSYLTTSKIKSDINRAEQVILMLFYLKVITELRLDY